MVKLEEMSFIKQMYETYFNARNRRYLAKILSDKFFWIHINQCKCTRQFRKQIK